MQVLKTFYIWPQSKLKMEKSKNIPWMLETTSKQHQQKNIRVLFHICVYHIKGSNHYFYTSSLLNCFLLGSFSLSFSRSTPSMFIGTMKSIIIFFLWIFQGTDHLWSSRLTFCRTETNLFLYPVQIESFVDKQLFFLFVCSLFREFPIVLKMKSSKWNTKYEME